MDNYRGTYQIICTHQRLLPVEDCAPIDWGNSLRTSWWPDKGAGFSCSNRSNTITHLENTRRILQWIVTLNVMKRKKLQCLIWLLWKEKNKLNDQWFSELLVLLKSATLEGVKITSARLGKLLLLCPGWSWSSSSPTAWLPTIPKPRRASYVVWTQGVGRGMVETPPSFPLSSLPLLPSPPPPSPASMTQ